MLDKIKKSLKKAKKSIMGGNEVAQTSDNRVAVDSVSRSQPLPKKNQTLPEYLAEVQEYRRQKYLKEARTKKRLKPIAPFHRVNELPIEIREMIWTYAMQAEVMKREENYGGVGANYVPSFVIALRAHKVLYWEALAIFYTMNEFLLCSTTFLGVWSDSANGHIWPRLVHLRIDLRNMWADPGEYNFHNFMSMYTHISTDVRQQNSPLHLATNLKKLSIDGEGHSFISIEEILFGIFGQSTRLQTLEIIHKQSILESKNTVTTAKIPWQTFNSIQHINRRCGVRGGLLKPTEVKLKPSDELPSWFLYKWTWRAPFGDRLKLKHLEDVPDWTSRNTPALRAKEPVVVEFMREIEED